ncbi:DUF6397 family protein [Streptomyces gobiensis]|uniref:DUF6397 family protein n=1 Tax=Streptomyces gobiensis TaxID=2875706 RepID=UPI001E316614|nr:DUF6397 family protein [Streptomyces gobiensis]UGY94665.1 DUF6397 family protein [Streptomyces gobiensis]
MSAMSACLAKPVVVRPEPGMVSRTVSMSRAGRELGLTPRELALAVELGLLRTAPPVRKRERRRIPVTELVRARSEEGFPASLRQRLRLMGATGGAELLGVGPARFARLARAGCFSPVRFSVNRYRHLVWLYLATELRQFAERQSALLHGPLPSGVRAVLKHGEDWRPRHWRARRIGQLLRQTDDPWEAAAVHAAVLDQDAFEEAVPEPAERLLLGELRPSLAPWRPVARTTWEVIGDVLTAESEEEIRWHRMNLTLALGMARATGPAPARSVTVRPEQALLDHGDQQLSLPVVDTALSQAPAAGRDG